jgi:hypothetical protein
LRERIGNGFGFGFGVGEERFEMVVASMFI